MDKLSDDVLLLSFEKAKKVEDIDEKFIELLKSEIIKRDLPLEIDK
ncbi:sporulation histidine kinase inhibitor Sda [Siminovitchia acidinfaciens]|uniref:Sporulation histidine kinase inhibitor Sda n=1 Tax=Siminovitchia acidinfaciens TaxID=2321395 RepID=A0A429XZ70_9BACI|nr:sporulation histidine kinase inhibitor Sda [Siminovitchia acidinfaciens]RST74084.1 sporulation histidine kinase inhibitor Sda [Siminovitchia acidinfaciens]